MGIFDAIGHEFGVFFGKGGTVDKIAHDIGHTVNNVTHDVGHFIDNAVKTGGNVIKTVHDDVMSTVKSVTSLPRDIVKQVPQVLESAGTAVSTAGKGVIGDGIGNALQKGWLPLAIAGGVGAIFLLKR